MTELWMTTCFIQDNFIVRREKIMNYKLIIIFCFCLIPASPAFSQEDVIYTGSAEVVGLAALNDWSDLLQSSPGDLYEDLDFGTSLSTRFKLELRPSDGVSAVLEGSSSFIGGYVNPYGRYETTGLPPDEAYTDASELPGADFNSLFNIEQAWVSWGMGSVDISMGFIPIGWGSAWLLNPSDRVNLRSLESFFSDENGGLPSLTADMALGWNFGLSGYLILTDTTQSSLPYLEETRLENLPFGIKAMAFMDGWELSAGLARETFAQDSDGNTDPSWQREIWAVSDLTGDISSFGITMESAVRLSSERVSDEEDWTLQEALELSMGISSLIETIETEMMIEYIHLGSGTSRPEDYDVSGFLEGTRLFFAEDYLFGRLAWTGRPDLTLEVAALLNLNDASILAMPSLEWEIETDILFTLGWYFSLGDETSEFGGDRLLAPGLYWSPWADSIISCGMKVYF
jgi:hypothetical protein